MLEGVRELLARNHTVIFATCVHNGHFLENIPGLTFVPLPVPELVRLRVCAPRVCVRLSVCVVSAYAYRRPRSLRCALGPQTHATTTLQQDLDRFNRLYTAGDYTADVEVLFEKVLPSQHRRHFGVLRDLVARHTGLPSCSPTQGTSRALSPFVARPRCFRTFATNTMHATTIKQTLIW
jgi:hypothetical protein